MWNRFLAMIQDFKILRLNGVCWLLFIAKNWFSQFFPAWGGSPPLARLRHTKQQRVALDNTFWILFMGTSFESLCSAQNLLISAFHGSYHWLSSSIFPCSSFVCLFVRPTMVTPYRISLLFAPNPQNPYIFWKLMIIAIQKWIRNTNTKTKTNTKTITKTITKTKTPRE